MSHSSDHSKLKTTSHGMTKPGLTGAARLFAATEYSLKGIKATWQSEEAFRMEVILSAVCIPLSFVVGQTLSHQLILVLSCGLILLAEFFNSAIEAVVDRIGSEHHPLSGQAKDIGSAGVFLTLVLFAITWSTSLWQYFSG